MVPLTSGAILRGDLRRSTAGQHVVISMGRYCNIGEGSIIRPPGKMYKGCAWSGVPGVGLTQRQFTFYPVRITDCVFVAEKCIVEAAQIGMGVEIGANCIIVSCLPRMYHDKLTSRASLPSSKISR